MPSEITLNFDQAKILFCGKVIEIVWTVLHFKKMYFLITSNLHFGAKILFSFRIEFQVHFMITWTIFP